MLSGIGPGDWLRIAARTNPEGRCFVLAEGAVRTFDQVDGEVNRLARALGRLGLRKGDRIAIMGTDSIEYVELLLASMKIGTTFVPLNFRLSAGEVANLCRACEPVALFYASRYRKHVEVVKETCAGSLRTLVSLDADDGDAPTIAGLIGAETDGSELPRITSDDDILGLPLTSGTTGTPKGVLQSQRMIKAVTLQGVLELQIQPDDLLYSGAPIFHISGMGHMFYALSRGAASLILPQFGVDAVLDKMQRGGVTRCMLVPSMIIALLEHPRVQDASYGQLRSIMYGGAPMPPSTIRAMASVFGCDLYNGFGAGTEAGGQTMLKPADHRRAFDDHEELLGSIGRPIYGVDLKLCDGEGREVRRGEVGEIWTRSDTVMSGYLNQPEKTAHAVVDGWFRAGDLARWDESGLLFLEGRADDMIIRGGENVYPIEIEEVLAEHPDLIEVAVIGLPDDKWGQIVAAVVVVRAGAHFDLEQLQLHCRAHIASYKVPQRLFVVDDLPRNPTGKIEKRRLRDLVGR